MNNRYYMVDFGATGTIPATITARDAAALRCGRYTSLDRAMRDLNAAVGGRFRLFDRQTGELIEPYSERTRMAFGRDDEQTECMLIGGEIVR